MRNNRFWAFGGGLPRCRCMAQDTRGSGIGCDNMTVVIVKIKPVRKKSDEWNTNEENEKRRLICTVFAFSRVAAVARKGRVAETPPAALSRPPQSVCEGA